MLSRALICFAAVCCFVSYASAQKMAIAHLVSKNITGTLIFTETSNSIHAEGDIVGLGEGLYGFYIHELGDIRTCDASGAIFNPKTINHSGRDHDVRHVGDLGNVISVSSSDDSMRASKASIMYGMYSLEGRNSIIGRTLVVHELPDDFYLNWDEDSLSTGNVGARVACGVIGILSPAGPWNSKYNI